MNQTPREIIFDNVARAKLVSGIKKMAAAVKSTLGAAGQTVLIESPNHLHGIRISKDGVTVANEIFFEDPVENLAAQIIRDVAARTSSSAGDGTTTATVLAEALTINCIEMISAGDDKTEILREVKLMSEKVLLYLKSYSKKLTKGRMKDVATISANNDKNIGSLVASAYHRAGKNALVSVSNSDGGDTYVETTKGIRFKRGYDSPAYVNEQSRDECVLEKPFVLITDHQLETFNQIKSILEYVVKNQKPLLIIGNVSNNFKNMLSANVVKNGMKLCSIVPPQFGYKQSEILSDLAEALGGTFFSEKTGDDLSLIDIDDLGSASRIVVGREDTVITKDENTDINVATRIVELKEQIKITKKKSDVDHLHERIAILDGGMGVIYAGGNSDVEQKELFDRIDDAVCAVRSALEDGVIPGGGVPLLRISYLLSIGADNTPRGVACKIISNALSEPFRQILRNAGKDEAWIDTAEGVILSSSNKNYGIDVKSSTYVDLTSQGILDPLKVTMNAVSNAISVAITIASTNAIITMAREK